MFLIKSLFDQKYSKKKQYCEILLQFKITVLNLTHFTCSQNIPIINAENS